MDKEKNTLYHIFLNKELILKIPCNPKEAFERLGNCCHLILNFNFGATIFSSWRNRLPTPESKVCTNWSWDALIMNYFIFQNKMCNFC
jgi:hypothetical protein